MPWTLCLTPWNNFTGLTLAYRFKPERSPRITCPPAKSPFGRRAPGQPIAPRRIASELSLQCSKDPSGHSFPVSRYYCPPQGISVISKEIGVFSSNTDNTLIASATTSLPVPSPGSTVTRYSAMGLGKCFYFINPTIGLLTILNTILHRGSP